MSGSANGTGLYRLGPVDQIPLGEGRAFAVGDEQMAVFRLREGRLRALAAVSPHRGGPLADGLVDGQQVVCPLLTVQDGELVLRPRGKAPVTTVP